MTTVNGIRGLGKIRHDQWIPGKILPHFDPSYLSVGLQDYIVSPSPSPFPLDFGLWIYDLDLVLRLDNKFASFSILFTVPPNFHFIQFTLIKVAFYFGKCNTRDLNVMYSILFRSGNISHVREHCTGI